MRAKQHSSTSTIHLFSGDIGDPNNTDSSTNYTCYCGQSVAGPLVDPAVFTVAEYENNPCQTCQSHVDGMDNRTVPWPIRVALMPANAK